MSYWQGIMYIITNTIITAKWKNTFVVLYITYMGFLSAVSLTDLLTYNQTDESSTFMNFVFFVVFAYAGMLSNYNYGYNFSQDVINERLMYYRTLPIKVNQIVWAKLIMNVLFCFITLISFIIIVYFYAESSEKRLDPYLTFVNFFVMFAITLIINLYFLYIELAKSYKKYLAITFCLPLIFIIIFILLDLLVNFNLLERICYFVKIQPELMLATSIIVIIASIIIGYYCMDKNFRIKNIT